MLEKQEEGPKVLGIDPDSKKPVYLKEGRFGTYLQLGDPEEIPKVRGKGTKTIKPKNASLLPNMDASSVTLDIALSLLALPRPLEIEIDGEVKPTAQWSFWTLSTTG